MRRPGISKLDQFRDRISSLVEEGKTVADIRRELIAVGCETSHTTLASWIARNLHTPQDKKDMSESFVETSFGLLDAAPDVNDKNSRSRLWLLRILCDQNVIRDRKEFDKALHICPGGMPVDANGEIDYRAYARMLGSQRLKTFGDLDFILLALWSRPIYESPHRLADEYFSWRKFAREVLPVARRIREEMREAANLEP